MPQGLRQGWVYLFAGMLAAFALVGCGPKEGKEAELPISLYVPADPNPFQDVQTLRASVVRGGDTIASADTPASEDVIKIPHVPKDGGAVRIVLEGLDSGGSAISRGQTRLIDPNETEGPYGLLFLKVGVFSRLVPALDLPVEGAATAVTGGKLLVIGGAQSGGQPVARIWVYDPDTYEVTTTSSLGVARTRAAAATLADGRVLVVGGFDGSAPVASTEIYDPETETLSAGPDLQTARDGASIFVVGDAQVLVIGGETVAAPAEIVDVAAQTSTTVSGSVARAAPGAAMLSDGSIFVAGGTDGGAVPLDSVETIDAAGTAATPGAPLAVARSGIAAAATDSGAVLLAGGDRGGAAVGQRYERVAELQDTGRVFAPDRMLQRRAGAAALSLDAGVLLAGGTNDAGAVDAVEWFDGSQFLAAPSLVTARGVPSLLMMPDGAAFVVGGGETTLEAFLPGGFSDTKDRVDLQLTSVVPPTPSPDPFPAGASEVVFTVFDAAGPVLEATADPAGAPSPGAQAADGPSVVFDGFQLDDDVALRVEVRDGDGQVLAWGGSTRVLQRADVESGSLSFFVGRTDAWSVTATPMTHTRQQPTAAPLPDGRAIVIGGGGSGNGTAEIFDPQTGTFDAPIATGTNRNIPRAAVLADGRVMVSGSGNGTVAVDIFDSQTGFAAGDSLTDVRSFNTLTTLPDGTVVAVGGRTGADETTDPPVETAEVWDDGTWGAPINMVQGRQRHAAAVDGDGNLVVTGGMILVQPAPTDPPETPTPVVVDSSEVFDGNTFQNGPTLNQARRDHAMATLPDGSVIACGGIDGPQGTGASTVDTCETLAPGGNTWVLDQSLQAARDDLIVLVLDDGRALAIAGAAAGAPNTVVDIVYPLPAQPGPPLNLPRTLPAGCVVNDGRAVVFGGQDGGTDLDTAEVFTPAAWPNPFLN